MGIVQHHAIIATTQNEELIPKAKKWISDNVNKYWQRAFAFGVATSNSTQTVVLTPDGSNDGWAVSAAGDMLRDAFIDFLKTDAGWHWVEVAFGELVTTVVRSN